MQHSPSPLGLVMLCCYRQTSHLWASTLHFTHAGLLQQPILDARLAHQLHMQAHRKLTATHEATYLASEHVA